MHTLRLIFFGGGWGVIVCFLVLSESHFKYSNNRKGILINKEIYAIIHNDSTCNNYFVTPGTDYKTGKDVRVTMVSLSK